MNIPPNPRGRPRSDASRKAILKAAFAVLKERGYEGMAIELVAERAKVGKTTIYRWWPNRAELAVDAFFDSTKTILLFPNKGSAKEDFRQQIQELAAFLSGSTGMVLAAMIAGGRTDKLLAKALGERWVMPRKKWGIERLQKAVADSECIEGLNIEAALSLMYSPIYTPMLFGMGVPTMEKIDAYLDIAFKGIFV